MKRRPHLTTAFIQVEEGVREGAQKSCRMLQHSPSPCFPIPAHVFKVETRWRQTDKISSRGVQFAEQTLLTFAKKKPVAVFTLSAFFPWDGERSSRKRRPVQCRCCVKWIPLARRPDKLGNLVEFISTLLLRNCATVIWKCGHEIWKTEKWRRIFLFSAGGWLVGIRMASWRRWQMTVPLDLGCGRSWRQDWWEESISGCDMVIKSI